MDSKAKLDLLSKPQLSTVDRIRDTIPPAVNILPTNSLPSWNKYPLEKKFPKIPAPKDTFTFGRNTVGQSVFVSDPTIRFDNEDPQMQATPSGYNALHDPNLQEYFEKNPKTFNRLVKAGLVDPVDGAVHTDMKEFNKYRAYLGRLRNSQLSEELNAQDKTKKAEREQIKNIHSRIRIDANHLKEKMKSKQLKALAKEKASREIYNQLKTVKPTSTEGAMDRARELAAQAVHRDELRKKVKRRLDKIKRAERRRARKLILEWYCRELYVDMMMKARAKHKADSRKADLKSFVDAKREFQKKKEAYENALEQKRQAERECHINNMRTHFENLEAHRIEKLRKQVLEAEVKAQRELYLMKKFATRWLQLVRIQKEYSKTYHDSVWSLRRQLLEMVKELKQSSGKVSFTNFIQGLVSMKPGRQPLPKMTEETAAVMNYILDLLISTAFETYQNHHRPCRDAYEKQARRREILGQPHLTEEDFEPPDDTPREKVELPFNRPKFPCDHPCSDLREEYHDDCCECDEAEELVNEELKRAMKSATPREQQAIAKALDSSDSSTHAEENVNAAITKSLAQLGTEGVKRPKTKEDVQKKKKPAKLEVDSDSSGVAEKHATNALKNSLSQIQAKPPPAKTPVKQETKKQIAKPPPKHDGPSKKPSEKSPQSPREGLSSKSKVAGVMSKQDNVKSADGGEQDVKATTKSLPTLKVEEIKRPNTTEDFRNQMDKQAEPYVDSDSSGVAEAQATNAIKSSISQIQAQASVTDTPIKQQESEKQILSPTENVSSKKPTEESSQPPSEGPVTKSEVADATSKQDDSKASDELSTRRESTIMEESSTKRDSQITDESSTKRDSKINDESSSKRESLVTEESSTKRDSKISEEISTKRDSIITEESSTKRDSKTNDESLTDRDSKTTDDTPKQEASKSFNEEPKQDDSIKSKESQAEDNIPKLETVEEKDLPITPSTINDVSSSVQEPTSKGREEDKIDVSDVVVSEVETEKPEDTRSDVTPNESVLEPIKETEKPTESLIDGPGEKTEVADTASKQDDSKTTEVSSTKRDSNTTDESSTKRDSKVAEESSTKHESKSTDEVSTREAAKSTIEAAKEDSSKKQGEPPTQEDVKTVDETPKQDKFNTAEEAQQETVGEVQKQTEIEKDGTDDKQKPETVDSLPSAITDVDISAQEPTTTSQVEDKTDVSDFVLSELEAEKSEAEYAQSETTDSASISQIQKEPSSTGTPEKEQEPEKQDTPKEPGEESLQSSMADPVTKSEVPDAVSKQDDTKTTDELSTKRDSMSTEESSTKRDSKVTDESLTKRDSKTADETSKQDASKFVREESKQDSSEKPDETPKQEKLNTVDEAPKLEDIITAEDALKPEDKIVDETPIQEVSKKEDAVDDTQKLESGDDQGTPPSTITDIDSSVQESGPKDPVDDKTDVSDVVMSELEAEKSEAEDARSDVTHIDTVSESSVEAEKMVSKSITNARKDCLDQMTKDMIRSIIPVRSVTSSYFTDLEVFKPKRKPGTVLETDECMSLAQDVESAHEQWSGDSFHILLDKSQNVQDDTPLSQQESKQDTGYDQVQDQAGTTDVDEQSEVSSTVAEDLVRNTIQHACHDLECPESQRELSRVGDGPDPDCDSLINQIAQAVAKSVLPIGSATESFFRDITPNRRDLEFRIGQSSHHYHRPDSHHMRHVHEENLHLRTPSNRGQDSHHRIPSHRDQDSHHRIPSHRGQDSHHRIPSHQSPDSHQNIPHHRGHSHANSMPSTRNIEIHTTTPRQGGSRDATVGQHQDPDSNISAPAGLPADQRENVLRTLSNVQHQLDAIRRELQQYGVLR